MSWIKALYPKVRAVLDESTPDFWPGLREVMGGLFEEPIPTEAALPLASCRAVGGDAEDAVYVTAALLAFSVAMRLYDDVEDQDRPTGLWAKVGPARAYNFGSTAHVLSFDILSKAPLAHNRFRAINQLFIDSFYNLAAGQDRDLARATMTIEDYWLTIEMKTGAAFALACACGAMTGTEDPSLIEGCRHFGHHVGLTLQIFNDMDSIWHPSGITDTQQGKVTLPLLYAMSLDHPGRNELISYVHEKQVAFNAERIKTILDETDTRNFLLWAALKEREQALEALSICPENEGKDTLQAYITGMFGDIRSLEQKTKGRTSRDLTCTDLPKPEDPPMP
jgi:geranylgeranyl diphosphate synthase type I